MANAVFDAATDKERIYILSFITCIFAADKDVSRSETKFLKRLLG